MTTTAMDGNGRLPAGPGDFSMFSDPESKPDSPAPIESIEDPSPLRNVQPGSSTIAELRKAWGKLANIPPSASGVLIDAISNLPVATQLQMLMRAAVLAKLAKLGIPSPSLRPRDSAPTWSRLLEFDGPVDSTNALQRLRRNVSFPPRLFPVESEVKKLPELLETTPTTALTVPERASPAPPAAPPPRIDVDVAAVTVTLDGKPYPVKQEGAILVQALLRKKGWQSSHDLAKGVFELKGKRLDRIRDKLPEKIQALIETKPGAGYRLKPEVLD
jgi:hypothetical protein